MTNKGGSACASTNILKEYHGKLAFSSAAYLLVTLKSVHCASLDHRSSLITVLMLLTRVDPLLKAFISSIFLSQDSLAVLH